jgi:F-type H+-transporting ATPase subunit b
MAGETHAAGAAGEHAGGGFPPFDASLFSHQIFWWAVSFGTLYLILANVVIPRLTKAIETRRETIAADLKRAADETAAAQGARAGADQAAAEARAKARQTVEAARKVHEDAAAAAEAKAGAEAATRIAEAEARIAVARASALSGIGDVVGDLAATIVDRVGGAKPTAAALKKAVAAVTGAN